MTGAHEPPELGERSPDVSINHKPAQKETLRINYD